MKGDKLINDLQKAILKGRASSEVLLEFTDTELAATCAELTAEARAQAKKGNYLLLRLLMKFSQQTHRRLMQEQRVVRSRKPQ